MWALLATVQVSLAASPPLEQGRAWYRAMEYDRALEALAEARRAPSLSVAERREAFDLLARCHSALGRTDQAEATYAELLAADPNAPAPEEVAPKIRAAFQRAKERLYAANYVRLEQRGVQRGVIEVRVLDPWQQVRTVRLLVAMNGSLVATELLYRDSVARAALPVIPGGVRYYVEARDGAGTVVGELGTRDRPLFYGGAQPPIAAEAQSRDLGPPRWLPWTLTATAAVAAVAGGLLGASSQRDATAAAAATYASDRRALDDAAFHKAVGANLLGGSALVTAGFAGWLFLQPARPVAPPGG